MTESDKIEEKDFNESHRLSMIAYEASNASFHLNYDKYLSILEIKKCIENIKEQMK